MLAKRIIPCLDVKDNMVVKGVQFRNHEVVGNILSLAKEYVKAGADELVFYDITASSSNRLVDKNWVLKVSKELDIPFCVAGGITTLDDVEMILSLGADKISINSPAIINPDLITCIAKKFGIQCVVVAIDSWFDLESNSFCVYQYTGDENKIKSTKIDTISWIKEVQNRGAGEIVLNVMNQDGLRNGYDLVQLIQAKQICDVPLIASGGAGCLNDFYDVFCYADVEGALAASVFHNKLINIKDLKQFLLKKGIEVNL